MRERKKEKGQKQRPWGIPNFKGQAEEKKKKTKEMRSVARKKKQITSIENPVKEFAIQINKAV